MTAVPAFQLDNRVSSSSSRSSLSEAPLSPKAADLGDQFGGFATIPVKQVLVSSLASLIGVGASVLASQIQPSEAARVSLCVIDALAALFILGYSLRSFLVGFLKKPSPGKDLLIASTIVVASVFLLHHLAFQFLELSTQPWWRSPSLLFGLIALIRFSDAATSAVLRNSLGFDLSRLMPQAKVVTLGDAQNSAESRESLLPSLQLKPDMLVRLGAGDFVPCDGVVVNGHAEVEERRLSGLSARRVKSSGLELWAGSRISCGEVTYRIVSSAEDSFIAYSCSALISALRPFVDEIRGASQRFGSINVGILVAALFSGVIWLQKGASSFNAEAVVESILLAGVLVHGLALAMHVPLLALTRLWTKGVLVKDRSVLGLVAQAKAVALDFDPNTPPGASIVQHFEVIDERVDRPRLMAALLTLLGQSDSERDIEMARFLSQEVKEPLVKEVRGFRTYPELGLCGELDGIEITVGTESFLLERGVQLQASESVGDSPDVLYVALNDSIVARFDIGSEFESYGRDLVKDIQRQGLKTWILSAASNEFVDPIGKKVGIELAYVAGGLTPTKFSEKLEGLAPCLAYAISPPATLPAKEGIVTMSVFDEIGWNLSNTSLTVFGRRLSPISDTLKVAKQAKRLALLLSWVGVLGALGICLLTYLVNPGATVAASAGLAFLLFANVSLGLLGPGFVPSVSSPSKINPLPEPSKA